MLAELPLHALNRLLASEAWARQLLAPHIGQTAVLEIAGWSLRFTVDDKGGLLPAAAGTPSNVSICIPVDALGKLSEGPDTLRTAARIEGNAGFAETLAMLIQHLRPDPAAWLSPWLGDVLAHRLTRSTRTLAIAGLETGQRLGAAGVDILRQNYGVLPSRTEFSRFSSDLVRLAARLDKLERR